jgi:hypothetical protein
MNLCHASDAIVNFASHRPNAVKVLNFRGGLLPFPRQAVCALASKARCLHSGDRCGKGRVLHSIGDTLTIVGPR